jgi:hypothetical protein
MDANFGESQNAAITGSVVIEDQTNILILFIFFSSGEIQF